MAYKKKTGGRKKGTQNKTTKELKEAINHLVSNNIDTLQSDLDSLEPKERILMIERFLKYCIPKVEFEDNNQTQTIVLKLDEDDLKA